MAIVVIFINGCGLGIDMHHTVYGKTSARENFRGYKKKPLSLEKFRGFCAEEKVWPRETMCIATAKTFTGKLSRKAENPRKLRKFSHADVLPYTVDTNPLRVSTISNINSL